MGSNCDKQKSDDEGPVSMESKSTLGMDGRDMVETARKSFRKNGTPPPSRFQG